MVQLQAIMARRLASMSPPVQSDQDAVAADTFTISDDEDTNNWSLHAFHEKWAPLGGQAVRTPHLSAASGCATRTEREVVAQLETLQIMKARIQQMGNEAVELGQHVRVLLSAKNAEIARLRGENEEYHFICNMATKKGKQMEFQISNLMREVDERDQEIETLRWWEDRFKQSSIHYHALLRRALERMGARLSKYRLRRRCR